MRESVVVQLIKVQDITLNTEYSTINTLMIDSQISLCKKYASLMEKEGAMMSVPHDTRKYPSKLVRFVVDKILIRLGLVFGVSNGLIPAMC